MGSVLALSSNPGHQNWPFSKDHLPSRWDAHPAHWDRPPRWERRDGRLPNPGSFHSLHRSCKDVFPHQIEGVKMIINKTLSSFFKVSHTLHLSAVSPSYYRFHVEHLQSDDYSKDKDAPALIGEMDSSGSLNAHALLHLTERVRARTVFQTQQSQFVTWQFETEYRGSDFTAAVTVANPDVLRESVILVAHFLQSVSSGLVLGGELVYHRGRAEEGGILTLAGQYSRRNWVATLNAGKGGAHASYYHRANKQIQVGVEFEASTRTQETTASFGYQMDLPEANMVFRGSLRVSASSSFFSSKARPSSAASIRSVSIAPPPSTPSGGDEADCKAKRDTEEEEERGKKESSRLGEGRLFFLGVNMTETCWLKGLV